MSDSLDCIIAGAGVIGLAVGRRLALAGLEVAVLEAEDRIGAHTSSRNSEVIHAGIYYPKGSLKGRLCVAGKAQLYDYCEQTRVPHRRIGKLIVATCRAEEAALTRIRQIAVANGVDDLRPVSARELARIEPSVNGTAALFSPSTGIVDSHALMQRLQADFEAAGGVVVLRSPVRSVACSPREFRVSAGDDTVFARRFVNAAGLWALELAGCFTKMSVQRPAAMHFARGHYYAYSGPSPFQHLVYPVPSDGGLGVHATIDMAGGARFGPDVKWIDSVDYRFDDAGRSDFLAAIRRYFPGVQGDRLNPSYTGIRPKLSGPGESAADFRIDGPREHGVPGLVNLFGIESPGLTASLAIADHVRNLLPD